MCGRQETLLAGPKRFLSSFDRSCTRDVDRMQDTDDTSVPIVSAHVKRKPPKPQVRPAKSSHAGKREIDDHLLYQPESERSMTISFINTKLLAKTSSDTVQHKNDHQHSTITNNKRNGNANDHAPEAPARYAAEIPGKRASKEHEAVEVDKLAELEHFIKNKSEQRMAMTDLPTDRNVHQEPTLSQCFDSDKCKMMNDKSQWCLNSILADTGATKHVSPNHVSHTQVKETEQSKPSHKVYAATGSEIPNRGGQAVVGTSTNSKHIAMEFNIGDISRSIASISDIAGKGNRAVFDQEKYIEKTESGAWMPLRKDGNLFYLDSWCDIPSKLADNPFVRHVEQ